MKQIDFILESKYPPKLDSVLWLKDGDLYTFSKGNWINITNNSKPYLSLRKLSEYLYLIEYNNLDYQFADTYLRTKNNIAPNTGCSSFRVGNLYCRNLDWYYDNTVEFVVHTPATNDTYEVWGVAGGLSLLNTKTVEENTLDNEKYFKILPFFLQDGCNEKGVFCNINVVPTDKGVTTGTTPSIEKREDVCLTALVRYILDHFDSADDAIDYITKYVRLYPSKALQDLGYESHFMIGDSSKTYVLEIINNEIEAVESSIMTNFHLYDVTLNEDGSVYTPADVTDAVIPEDETEEATEAITPTGNNNITDYGSGLERFNLIASNIENIDSVEKARALLELLYYTRAYSTADSPSNPYWYTEFVTPVYNLTVDSKPEAFQTLVEKYGQIFLKRDRNTPINKPRTWLTTHSSIYDLSNNKLYVVSLEESKEFSFDV